MRRLAPEISEVLCTYDSKPEVLVDWQPAGSLCTVALRRNEDDLQALLIDSAQEAEEITTQGGALFFSIPLSVAQRYTVESLPAADT